MKTSPLIKKLCIALTVISVAPMLPAEESTFTAKANLGNVMYVGDSITHGVGSGSYRWALFKLLTDNGIIQNEVGVNSGNYNNYSIGNTTYGGISFKNIHSSVSSERAYEIAGRTNTSGRLGNSNIFDWLGLDNTYTGTYKIANGDTPDTFFMMIGTNDLLSDASHISTVFAEKRQNLLGTCTNGIWDGTGDMDTIVTAMRQSNPDAQIVITNIPTWKKGRSNNNEVADFSAIATYNQHLAEWGEQNNVTVVDVNKGITDVAETTYAGAGVANMFNVSDGLHPSAQGDLLIAGNLAKTLGYAGRSAGQERKSATDFSLQIPSLVQNTDNRVNLNQGSVSTSSLTLESGGSLTFETNAEDFSAGGYTVDFTLSSGIGNGITDGWDTSNLLSVVMGNGSISGTLNISEAYISWDSTVLYSINTSADLTESLRVAYVKGNATQGLSSGYYVWLDDMMIGEALSGNASDFCGLSIANNSTSSVSLGNLSMETNGSYAPVSSGYINKSLTILPSSVESGPGTVSWDTSSAVTVLAENSGDVRNATGTSSGDIVAVISSGAAAANTHLNKGNYTGNIKVSITDTVSAGSSFNSLHTSGTLTGSVSLCFDREYESTSQWGTWFGSVNSDQITGDVYMEYSSSSYISKGGTYTVTPTGATTGTAITASVAGSFNASIGGKVTMVFNDGNFNASIYGGAIYGNGTIGSSALYLNGGSFAGNIYAGGFTGTISGNTQITITGNNIAFGGEMISAGNFGGNATIGGNSQITISNLKENGGGFANYNGTISGGTGVTGTRTLIFDQTQHSSFNAQLENFDAVSVQKSTVGLTSAGGAQTISVDGESTLILKSGANVSATVGNSGTVEVQNNAKLTLQQGADENTNGTYAVHGGELDINSQILGESVTVTSGSLSNLTSAYKGNVSIAATGNVILSSVDCSKLTELDIITSGATVSGLDGNITLECVSLALDETVAATPILLFGDDNGTISVTQSLSLSLSKELIEGLLSQESVAPLSLETNSASEQSFTLTVTDGTIVADLSNINILAEGYTLKATAINGGSITFAAIPEPTSSALMLTGLGLMALRRRRN